MLTARGRAEDVLRGFESGADDYLPKPFDLSVLIARLNALAAASRMVSEGCCRRSTNPSPARDSALSGGDEVFTFEGRTIDLAALELRTGVQTVRLTLMEAQLLRYLIKHEGKVVKRKAMLEEVWAYMKTQTRER